MTITLPEDLSDLLRRVAAQRNTTPEALLRDLLEADYYSVENVQKRIYERARKYWREHGDTERAALTDDELHEQFWLFTPDGIPRLQSDKAVIDDPGMHPLVRSSLELERLGLPGGPPDLSQNFKKYLHESWGDPNEDDDG